MIWTLKKYVSHIELVISPPFQHGIFYNIPSSELQIGLRVRIEWPWQAHLLLVGISGHQLLS